MDLTEITKEVQREFNEKRIREESNATKNLAVATKYPVFCDIVSLEKDLIFELGKAEAYRGKTSELKKNLKEVKASKKAFLKKLGLTESDLSPKYECTKCKDVGFVGTIPCECYTRAVNEKIIKKSGFDFDHSVSFDTFNFDIAKSETQKNVLSKVKSNLTKWCNKYPETPIKTIVLSGKTGVGKTYASECIASYFFDKNCSVCFITAFQINEMFLKYHTTFDSSKTSILVPLTECDLLVIDDLGTEPIINNVTINYLYLILAEREKSKKATVITTNLTETNLKDNYGDRIHSRLLDKFSSIFFKISGDDLRN